MPFPLLSPPGYVLLAALAAQLGAWAWLAAGLARVRRQHAALPPPDTLPPVSVVVAARDEAGRLPALLDALAAQTHPAWEAVVVDDGSADETAALVGHRADPRFRLLRVDPEDPATAGLPRKKRALAQGIRAARHGRLAFTDADGRPPPAWLATLARHAAAEPDAVFVGHGPLVGAPGALGGLVRYETLLTALLTAAAVGWGRPFMAVGRNLSYPRALFERLGGFAHQARSLSGDDDLLVQHVARTRAAPVRYVLAPEATVPSPAPATWRAWLRQKRRHTSAGRHYRPGVLAALAAFQLSGLLCWLAPLLLGWPGAGLLAVRLLVQRAALRPVADAFGARDLMAAQPLWDLFYTAYQAATPALGWRPPRRW